VRPRTTVTRHGVITKITKAAKIAKTFYQGGFFGGFVTFVIFVSRPWQTAPV
jgi:hypothetical protein